MKRIVDRVRAGWVQAWLVVALAALVVGIDQWTKYTVRATLVKGENVPVLGKWLMWQHVDNYGAAFGIAQDTSWLIVLVTAVAAIITAIVLWFVQGVPTEYRLIRLLFGLQLGGAVGNLVDRYLQGYVTDFVKMGIPDVYYWHVWNIADAAIITGTLGLIVYMVWTDIVVPRRVPNQISGSDAEAGGDMESTLHRLSLARARGIRKRAKEQE